MSFDEHDRYGSHEEVFYQPCSCVKFEKDEHGSQKHVQKLETAIMHDDSDSYKDIELCATEEIPNETISTVLKQSQFFRVFKEDVDSIPQQDGTHDNIYYSPGIVKDILHSYIGLLPLWTSLLLGDLSVYAKDDDIAYTIRASITRDTNSLIENYFGNVKARLQSKQRERLTTFVRKQHIMTQGMLK